MAEDRIQFTLKAPDNMLADIAVDKVVAPGVLGEFAVLPEHFDFVTYLEPGVIRAVDMQESEETVEYKYVVLGGFLEVNNNAVHVLADATELVGEIDVARAEAARKRAEERLAAHREDIDTIRAEMALRRALTRLDAVGE